MKWLIKIIPAVLLVTSFVCSCKKDDKKKEEEALACTLDCKNGGSCVNNACNCPADYSGPTCETFFTSTYSGEYTSSNFDCGQGPMATTFSVSVDPGNKNRLLIGGLYADMTDRTHFNLSLQGSSYLSGTGTIDGKNMTMMYSIKVLTITTGCNGSFTKK